MKPIIGVTASMEKDRTTYYTMKRNMDAIQNAGGIPFLLPYTFGDSDTLEIVNRIDGLYATGGYDIDPILFGEEPIPGLGTIIPERDQAELLLIKKVLETKKPILGVCRGSQIMNIAAGGDMYQDIYSQVDRELLQHRQEAPYDYGSHFVDVTDGSLLQRLTGENRFRINSFHHQSNRNPGAGFRISGTSSDGIVEAIEGIDHPFALGLQWHPEAMVRKKDGPSLKIYQGFIEACTQK